MTGEEVLEIFKKVGGYITGSHIVYTSGRHGEAYLNKDAIYPHTKYISGICLEIAKRNKDNNIDVVAAPALGGIILSQWTAFHLSEINNREIFGVYTEKTPEKNQIFTRGYGNLVKGKRVLVVEDITTTGGSVIKVVDSVKSAGGILVGVCVVVNRDPENINTNKLGFPYLSLAEVQFESYEEKDCPLCKKGVPINTVVGKGMEFLAQKA